MPSPPVGGKRPLTALRFARPARWGCFRSTVLFRYDGPILNFLALNAEGINLEQARCAGFAHAATRFFHALTAGATF